jgi:hypothetical protein
MSVFVGPGAVNQFAPKSLVCEEAQRILLKHTKFAINLRRSRDDWLKEREQRSQQPAQQQQTIFSYYYFNIPVSYACPNGHEWDIEFENGTSN